MHTGRMANSDYLDQIQHVQSMADTDGFYPCPIDVNIRHAVDINLPDLKWHNYDKRASDIKITNSARTVVVGGRWTAERPYITSGPLTDNYIFSQMHFHWGSNDNEGSEHTVESCCLPMELHIVHFKSSYVSQEEALKNNDGLVVVVYLFMLQENSNSRLIPITDALPSVISAYSSTYITPSSLMHYVQPFYNNYLMYWGAVITPECDHKILWMICREPIGISRIQLSKFRELRGPENQPMSYSFHGVHPSNDRSLFLVNGAKPLNTSLIPVSSLLQYTSQMLMSSQAQEFWPFINTLSCTNLQSPIDICASKAVFKKFPPLTFIGLWETNGCAFMENSGHTVTITLEDRVPLLEGGPLRGSYKFEQLHFHWALDDYAGSEHALDGQMFSMESHAVHIHTSCQNLGEAQKRPNGIAVVGNFLKVSDIENDDFAPISHNINKICAEHAKIEIPVDCFSWLKNNERSVYFTYPGSLTTPGNSTTVTWIVFPDPIYVLPSQAVHYLKMKNHVSLHRKEDLDMHSNAVLNNTILDRKIWHYTWMCLFQDMYLHLWYVLYMTLECHA